MAIVEEVADAPQVTYLTSAKDPLPASLRSRIPLQHPSSVRNSTKSDPLVSLPPDSSSAQALSDSNDAPPTTEPEKDSKEAFWDEIFDSLILTIPFSFLFLMLDILVYFQYNHRPTFSVLAKDMATAVPTIGTLVFYTNRHPNDPVVISLLVLASAFCGSRLIWLVNKASWSIVTEQAPAMGTMWIVSIVQLPLKWAMLALTTVAAWVWYSGLSIRP
ncbi:hypothetical protein BCR39DRAFT_522364 [Naematelia encephala]|uniref:DUF7719 domain-containing protein n=1 Tax=Naematelia encephala TaxID=71784 RepID=A0A1Y2BEL6_9TREE|nr:hypothetical protein BCR39DRAFT_522364 [Naematelia encephala]